MTEPANIAPAASPKEHEPEAVNVHYDTRLPELSRWRRMQIPVIAAAATAVLRALGPTLRFEALGQQHVERIHAAGGRAIFTFWHRSIISATWYWRHRGIVVLNTTNFDGQWTRRVIEGLGYGTAQGSSSRGGLKGLAVMARRMDEGCATAFTIDGPRGPRYVAKPGPVMLARRTGQPIVVFHIGLENAHTFEKSWDLMQLPAPFSRAVVAIAPPIHGPGDADQEMVRRKHEEMQASLERVRDVAEAWFRTPPDVRDRLRREWNA
ncbi:MAG: lysophospholipid acyltransferase family protein [Acidobacteria bacterium]|nr:lysophospholipid acyltransferase family protein [Acidobacteriota bacterium]